MAQDFNTRIEKLERQQGATSDAAILPRIEALESQPAAANLTTTLTRIEALEQQRPSKTDHDALANTLARIDALEAKTVSDATTNSTTVTRNHAATLTRIEALKKRPVAANQDVISRIDALEAKSTNQQTWADIVAQPTGNPSKPGLINVPPILRKQLHQAIDDQAEAEKRKNNLVVFNLPETPALQDIDQVKQIFTICEVPLNNDDLVKVERRGKKPTSAKEPARPLLMQFAGPEKKKRLLTNLHKFRDFQIKERPKGDDGTKADQLPLVRIDHDMTIAQREHKKILVAEAHEESKQGPHRVVIRGPPWALKKVSVPKVPAQQEQGAKPKQTPADPAPKWWFTTPNPSSPQPTPATVTSPTLGASAF